MTKKSREFVGYEYKKIKVQSEQASLYLDGYENFGWIQDENISSLDKSGKVSIQLKRDRKIINKMELTRLQRNFEACMEEIEALEASKTAAATIAAIATGLIGTVFMAGSTFAVTATPPIIWLCVLLAIPGFLGWILPVFIYKRMLRTKTRQLTPLIEAKQDEVYQVCEKGSRLIYRDV